ncbi:polysaccharide biosynthesis/export family protein [Candidatus Entotheonella palauensis]|nr:polysaccharide biosynthesis/export family protein [Candidatus Entotheonella palauensis]
MYQVWFLVLMVIWLLTAGCSLDPSNPPVADVTPLPYASTYRIGPEDKLTISVWKNDDISRTVVVRPDGMISLPLLNDVKAAGLTPEELRGQLTDKLQAYINNVELSVIINEIHSLKYSVLGEVSKPARYELTSRLTVLEAIAAAGGLKPFAARKRIVILRQASADDAIERIPFNYDQAAASNGTEGNPELQPGDIVMVPSSAF